MGTFLWIETRVMFQFENMDLWSTRVVSSWCWRQCGTGKPVSFTFTTSLTLCQAGWHVSLTFTWCDAVGGMIHSMDTHVLLGTPIHRNGMDLTFVLYVDLTCPICISPCTLLRVAQNIGSSFQCAHLRALRSSSMAGNECTDTQPTRNFFAQLIWACVMVMSFPLISALCVANGIWAFSMICQGNLGVWSP